MRQFRGFGGRKSLHNRLKKCPLLKMSEKRCSAKKIKDSFDWKKAKSRSNPSRPPFDKGRIKAHLFYKVEMGKILNLAHILLRYTYISMRNQLWNSILQKK